ncbi:MAG: c-type cytochrome [Limnohabitans sp.]
MNLFKSKIIAGAYIFAMSAAAHAITVTPKTLNLNVGGSANVTVSNVSGSVGVSNSNTSVVSVVKVSTYGYKITGFLTGNSTVTFKDRKGSASVAVTVSSTAPPTLSGRLLSSNCFQCHGTNGSGGFDRLAGSTEADILSELREFASGKEDPSGIMAAHAMGYTDAQLQNIAKYFSTIK